MCFIDHNNLVEPALQLLQNIQEQNEWNHVIIDVLKRRYGKRHIKLVQQTTGH